MESISSDGPDTARQQGQLNQAVRESLRDLSIHLLVLSHRVGGRHDLKGTDLIAWISSTVTARSARAHWHGAPGSTPPP